MSLQYAVIGLGEFGHSVMNTLIIEGCDVVAIDSDNNKIQEVNDIAAYAVAIDSTDEKALVAAGIKTVDVAVVAIGTNVQASIMTTLLLKELGIQTIIAKANNFTHGRVLRKIGATRVVYPEIDMGERVAKSILSTNIFEQIEVIKGYSILEIIVPSKFVGKSLKESKIRNKYNINVIAIIHNMIDENMKENKHASKKVFVPQADYILQKDDVFLVFGDEDNIEKFKE